MAHRNASIPHKNGGPFSKFPYARIIQKVVFLLIAVGVSCFVLRRQPEITTSSSRGTQEVNKFHVVSGRQILSLTSRGDDFNITSAYEPTTSSSGNETWNNTTTPTGSMEEKCTPAAYNEFPPDLFTNQQRVRGAVIVHVLVTLYMFYALAVVCDDFFIAALEECCERLNLSQDVAGATFMAAGSSAPELFTAILGVFIAKGDVGTGTIVGSAVFNILFVIGLCGILAGRMIVLSGWPLFRDSACYSLSVIILFIIIYDKTVTWYESLIMLIGYVLYILLMKFNRGIYGWVSNRLGLIEEDSTALSILSHGNDKKCYSSYVPFNDEIDDFAQTAVTSQPVIPADEAIRDSQRRVTLYEAALMMLMTRHFRPYTRFRSAAQRIILEIRRQRGRLIKLQSQSSVDPTEFLRRRRSVSVSISWTADAPWRRLPKLEDGILNICKWVVRIPVLAALHYTIPDCKKNEWRNWFLVAFFMSITWTAVFSYIMVWMVTLIGFTMGIPDTIMGITFLAAGTSVPDAFASLIVVKQGQGDMAVSNSIGSNVFDILVGLALPWFIQTSIIEPGSLATINSQGMVYSVIILFLIIIITIYSIYRCNWQLTKQLGIFLVALYFVFLVIFSLLEFNIVGNLNPPMCPE